MRKLQLIWTMSLLIATVCLLRSSIMGQEPDKIVVGTNLVTVNVLVTDNKGRYVKGLSQDQFSLYDNLMKQQIAHFSDADSPVSIGIVCEIHWQAPEQSRAIFWALSQFTAKLETKDDFFLMAFNEYGSVYSEFIPSATQVLDHLRVVRPGGASSFYDAAYHAATRLNTSRQLKKALIIISDGHDTNSTQSYNKLRDRLRTMDVQIYTIGITNPELDPLARNRHWFYEDVTRQIGRQSVRTNPEIASGRAVLDEISRESGGTSVIPESESEAELALILAQVARELHQQYSLAFYSTDTTTGKWHKIKVIAQTDSNLKLSYRKGYLIGRNQ